MVFLRFPNQSIVNTSCSKLFPYAKKEKGRDSITESRPSIINSQHLFIRFCMYSYITLWYHLLYLSVYIIAQRVDILKV